MIITNNSLEMPKYQYFLDSYQILLWYLPLIIAEQYFWKLPNIGLDNNILGLFLVITNFI